MGGGDRQLSGGAEGRPRPRRVVEQPCLAAGDVPERLGQERRGGREARTTGRQTLSRRKTRKPWTRWPPPMPKRGGFPRLRRRPAKPLILSQRRNRKRRQRRRSGKHWPTVCSLGLPSTTVPQALPPSNADPLVVRRQDAASAARRFFETAAICDGPRSPACSCASPGRSSGAPPAARRRCFRPPRRPTPRRA